MWNRSVSPKISIPPNVTGLQTTLDATSFQDIKLILSKVKIRIRFRVGVKVGIRVWLNQALAFLRARIRVRILQAIKLKL
jgi:hypothetical protein